MIKVGVTGGIGSGKSIVCQVFSKLLVPVYHADNVARSLTDTDPIIRKQLIALLGTFIYNGDLLDRPKMAEIIFNNSHMLDAVNQVIHPRVAKHFEAWCNDNAHFPYIVHESAILFESNTYKQFDSIVTVASPEEIRINRTMMRSKMTREKILAVMKNQLSEQERIERSDVVIVNDGLTLVIPQVFALHQKFTAQLSL